jgi:chaperonin GroES
MAKKSKTKTKTVSKVNSKASIKPLGDRVLIKPYSKEDLRKNEGKPKLDFVLPESMTQEKSAQGRVVAVGDGRWIDGKLIPVNVKVGDTVVFSKYSYDEVEYAGEEFYLLREENLLAILN